jgi:putative membrane protein
MENVFTGLCLEAARGNAFPCAMKSFLKRWLITTVAVLVAANIVPGIHYDTNSGLVVATLLLGILNAFVRPVMVVLSLPLLIFTLGLFILVINALLFYWVGHLLRTFHVDSFGSAFWGSLIVSVISLVLNSLTRSGDSRIQFRRGKPPAPPRPPPEGDGGPIIDV